MTTESMMAKQETILNLTETAKEFNITRHLVEGYIEHGELRAWQSKDGKRYSIPLSSAETVFGKYRNAIGMAEVARRAGRHAASIYNWVHDGHLTRLTPEWSGNILVDADEADAYIASRKAKQNGHGPAQPSLPTFPNGATNAQFLGVEAAVSMDQQRQRAGIPAEEPMLPSLLPNASRLDDILTAVSGQVAHLSLQVSTLAEAVRDLTDAAAADRHERAAMATCLSAQTAALDEFAKQVGNLGHWLGEAVVAQASKS